MTGPTGASAPTEVVWAIARRLYDGTYGSWTRPVAVWQEGVPSWDDAGPDRRQVWFLRAAELVTPIDPPPSPRRALIIDNAAQAAHYASECVGYEMRWTGAQLVIVNAVFASGYKMQVRSFVPQGETREDQRADADRVFREYVERLAAGEQVVDG